MLPMCTKYIGKLCTMSVVVGLLVLMSPTVVKTPSSTRCGMSVTWWLLGRTAQSAARCLCSGLQVHASRTDNTRSANRRCHIKLSAFLSNTRDSSCTKACSDLLVGKLHYSDEEMAEIEVATRGQGSNTNWHKAHVDCQQPLTSSVCVTSMTECKLLEDSKLRDDCLPASVAYGRQHEETARQMFLKSHRYHHRSSTITVPGLTLNSNYPYLGCNAAGILQILWTFHSGSEVHVCEQNFPSKGSSSHARYM